jgi:hypothetical protein
MRPSNVGLAREVVNSIQPCEQQLYAPNVPKRFARSPRRGADGWKNSRSYCSGLRETVTWRLNDAPFPAMPVPLCSIISWSIFTGSDMFNR